MKVEINQEQAEAILYALGQWISYNGYKLPNEEREILIEFSEKLKKISKGETEWK